MKKITGLVFYGNIFYGFCTVALSIETNLQHGIALNSIPFYVLTFLSTIVYYSRIYYRSSLHINSDDRGNWYRNNRATIRTALGIALSVLAVDVAYMVGKNYHALYVLPAVSWALILGVLMLGIMYTIQVLPWRKLRQVGWLKPFVIGFVWAGVVTIFPVLFWHIKHPGTIVETVVPIGLLWLQNFLFVSALAIVFDIKDYESDRIVKLKTIPATLGIPKTISLVIVPMAILSFFTLLVYHLINQSPVLQIVVQALPYLALLIICKSLVRQKNLLFYLAAIDGLMLFKALCGIISIIVFSR